MFFNLLCANQTGETPDPLPEGDFQKYYETTIKNSDDQSFEDTEQLFAPSVLQVGNYYHLYYIGNSQNVLAPTYGDIDMIFLARKSISDGLPMYKGWEKYSDVNGPIRMLDPGASFSDWDGSNMYLQKVIDMGDGTYRMYYNGLPDGTPTYKTGFATSSDGLTWTKYASNPIVTDANIFFKPYKDGADWYAIAKQGSQHKVYTSNNGIAWTFARNITLTGCRFITDIFKFGGVFYCYGYSDDSAYSDTYEKCFTTTDFTTFTDQGNSLTKLTESTKGLGHCCMFQYGTYQFAFFYSYYKYRIRLERVGVENPLISIRCATLTNSIPWKTTFRANFPTYVKQFFSVSNNNFKNLIGNISSVNVPSGYIYSVDEEYIIGNGTSTNITFPDSSLPGNLQLSVKCRVYKNLTGTHPIIKKGESPELMYNMYLENGKLVVNISSDGLNIDLQYKSIDNVDKPPTSRDVYDGAWVGFRFNNGDLKLYINNQEVSATRVIDNPILSINADVAGEILLKDGVNYSSNGTKNITVMSGETEAEYINWDMM